MFIASRRMRPCHCARLVGAASFGYRLAPRGDSIRSRSGGRFGGTSPSTPCMRFALLASADALSLFTVLRYMRLLASARLGCTLSMRYRVGHLCHFAVSVVLASLRPSRHDRAPLTRRRLTRYSSFSHCAARARAIALDWRSSRRPVPIFIANESIYTNINSDFDQAEYHRTCDMYMCEQTIEISGNKSQIH